MQGVSFAANDQECLRPFVLGLQSGDQSALEPITLNVNGTLPNYVQGYLHLISPAVYVLRDDKNVKLNHWFDGRPLLTRFEFHTDKVLFSNRLLIRKGSTKHAALRKRHEMTVGPTCAKPSTPGSILGKKTLNSSDTGMMTDPGYPTSYIHLATMENDDTQSGYNLLISGHSMELRFVNSIYLRPEFTMSLMKQPNLPFSNRAGSYFVTCPRPVICTDKQEAFMTMLEITKTSICQHVIKAPLTRLVANDPAAWTEVASMDLRRIAYHHTIAITPHFIILLDCPYVSARLLGSITSTRNLFSSMKFNKYEPTYFHVISRQTGKVRKFTTTPVFALTIVNACEEKCSNGEDIYNILLDLIGYNDSCIIDSLMVEDLRKSGCLGRLENTIRRYVLEDVLHYGNKKVTKTDSLTMYKFPVDADWYHLTSGRILEFVTISPKARNNKCYRHVWGLSCLTRNTPYYDTVSRVDLTTGSFTDWRRADNYVTFPTFVCNPASTHEDDGVIIFLALDVRDRRSTIMVLDAKEMYEVASIKLPPDEVVPYAVHAVWRSTNGSNRGAYTEEATMIPVERVAIDIHDV